MKQTKPIFLLIILIQISFFSGWSQVQFTEVVIDKVAHGDDKIIADIDNDGVKDLVLGGATLSWYREENGQYVKYKIADPKVEFTTDGYAGDVDNDGDMDMILADGKDAGNVM